MKKRTFVRKLLAVTIAAVMLLSAVPAMALFRDTAGHWAEKTIAEWQDQGRIDGYSDGGFHPNASVTRAEFAKLVNRTLGFTAECAISFSDVTESDWFHAEVARAVAAGYAQGSGGMFRPEAAVTRAEAAVMLARAAGLAANEERANAFADAASIPAWARGSVGAAAEAGYMNGYPNGAFGAGDSITRAEAVVTLDRVLRSVQETVMEKAGTTLENETVTGDLIIAETVGEGNVTLKNVTVLGNLIVRGGGANSVYLDGVRVNGAVRLEKEGVHIRLTGDTVLDRVEISLPCRITRDSSFKGEIKVLVIKLEKDSGRNILLEVPVGRMEFLSKANAALNADVEKLIFSEDAEGAQLEIKRGVTVGELTGDAKVKLTGSGTVSSLVVSVSGVTVSGSLTVKRTGTTGGAKAPTVAGGSSGGGSSAPVKLVTGAAAIPDVTVPYGTSEADAMSGFPASVTLNVTEGGKAGTISASASWVLDKTYEAQPRVDTVYTATGTVTIPAGYTYSGTLTVTAALTVKADPNTTVTSISEVAGLELPYGAQPGDARLPAEVTVWFGNGSSETVQVRWTLNGTWASPGVNTFTGTVTLPNGCFYNGETSATVTTTATVMESGATPGTKLVVNHVPFPVTSIGYAGTEELVLAAARPSLPTEVTLQCQDDSYITVTVPANDWRFTYTPYYPNSATTQTVSFKADAVLPAGYEDNGGTSPVYCSVEIKKLDTTALDSALTAAKAQLDTLTDSESDALADSTKIYVAPDNTGADKVAKGVKFIGLSQTTTLEGAYTAARDKKNSDNFASQAECDRLAQELQEASNAFGKITPNVGTFYTDAMLLETVKNGNAVNPKYSSEFAYSAEMQPLRYDYTYWLYENSGWTEPDSGVTVSLDWSFSGDGAQYLAFATEAGRDHKNNLHSYGVKVTGQPDAPKKVTFTVTVKRYDLDPNGTEVGKIDYTATVGAPISLSDNKANAPLFASGTGSTGEIYINLNGVEAIKSVDAGKIGIEGRKGDAGNPNYQQINTPKITGGRPSANGVRLDASLSSAQLRDAQNIPISGSSATPAHVTGEVTVTIPEGALTLDESKGWYFPDAALTQTVEIWLCNPQLSVNTQMATDGDTTHRNISVTAKYVGSAPVQVAYTKTDTAPDDNDPERDSNVWVWIVLSSEQSSPGSDGEKIYSASAVEGFGGAGTYYVWCRAWEGATGAWLDTGESFTVGGQDTP